MRSLHFGFMFLLKEIQSNLCDMNTKVIHNITRLFVNVSSHKQLEDVFQSLFCTLLNCPKFPPMFASGYNVLIIIYTYVSMAVCNVYNVIRNEKSSRRQCNYLY